MGIDSNGFTGKTVETITDEILEDTATALETTPGLLGPIIRRLALLPARPLVRLWELGRLAYDMLSPTASGVLLDRQAALAGITREPATRAQLQLTVEGDVDVVLPSGVLVRNGRLGVDFRLVSAHTIGALTVDNAVAFEAVDAGALILDATDTYTIQTPVSGWTGVSSPTKITNGKNAEDDGSLRLRRDDAVNSPRSNNEAAIARELLALASVEEVLVVSNRGTTTDANGIPPGGLRVFVWPTGLDDEDKSLVAETLYRVMPVGASSVGDEEFAVTDEQGYEQTVKFEFASAQNLYCEVVLSTTNRYPVGGDDLVKRAVEEEFNKLGISPGDETLKIAQLEAVARCAAPGISNVTVKLDLSNPPTDTEDFSLPIGTKSILQAVTVSS